MNDLRALFPLTLAHLGEDVLARYLESEPGEPDARRFAAFVARTHAQGTIPDRAARDLVNYEAALAEVRALAPPAPPGMPPGEEEPCVIAQDARVLVYGAALPDLVRDLTAGERATPRPARGWLVLRRSSAGPVVAIHLPREEGWFLESFRKPSPASEAIEDDEDRALFVRLYESGVLVRA